MTDTTYLESILCLVSWERRALEIYDWIDLSDLQSILSYLTFEGTIRNSRIKQGIYNSKASNNTSNQIVMVLSLVYPLT